MHGETIKVLLIFVNNSGRNIPFVVWNCIFDYKRRLQSNILGEWVSYLVVPYMNISLVPVYREWKEIIAQDHSGENSRKKKK